MAQLNLEFVGLKSLEGHVTVDGKFIKLKKVNQKYVCNIETTQPQAEVVIYQSHSYTGKHWLLLNLFYFLLSVFGLFDVRHGKRCLVQDARFKIDVAQDANLIIRRENFVDGGAFVRTETTAPVETICNQQYYDKVGKKRAAVMKKVKLAVAVLAVIAATVVVVML